MKLPLVEITESLVDDAAALAEDEALRGDNALHVAAALTVEATVLTSADDDLCAAGLRRGLHVANPLGDRPRLGPAHAAAPRPTRPASMPPLRCVRGRTRG